MHDDHAEGHSTLTDSLKGSDAGVRVSGGRAGFKGIFAILGWVLRRIWVVGFEKRKSDHIPVEFVKSGDVLQAWR